MCGIIGYIGSKPVVPVLIDGLRRLEYRGYDSAGVATLVNGHIDRRRAEGKLVNLEARLGKEPLAGTFSVSPAWKPLVWITALDRVPLSTRASRRSALTRLTKQSFEHPLHTWSKSPGADRQIALKSRRQ